MGIFFVSTFTVVPAMYVLYVLADKFNPFEVAVFAGLGALLGDYLIFRFLKDKIFEELKPLMERYSITWNSGRTLLREAINSQPSQIPR